MHHWWGVGRKILRRRNQKTGDMKTWDNRAGCLGGDRDGHVGKRKGWKRDNKYLNI